tara:strand:- start:97 stop:294 length:198 start_codon:yes stop_codon:yes gene_type:complete
VPSSPIFFWWIKKRLFSLDPSELPELESVSLEELLPADNSLLINFEDDEILDLFIDMFCSLHGDS